MADLPPDFLQQIATAVSTAVDEPVGDFRASKVGSGDISAAYRLRAGSRDYFIKTNSAARLDMFEAEVAALTEIAATDTVRVPMPLASGVADGRAYLVLEWLDLHPLDATSAARLGHALAALHRHTAAQFGWKRDNTIGATPQPNAWRGDWVAFWKEQRLGHQLNLAAERGYGGDLQSLGQRLLERCDALFTGYAPVPSLLHGDLWGGNAASDAAGQPVIYDPASYYGDREADLAMTALFGGFPPSFMRAYEGAWPVDEGYRLRRDFYNLYHLLNHLNLFGHGYLARSEAVMQRLLAELK